MITLPINARHQYSNHRPPVVDIRYKSQTPRSGRKTDSYSVGTTIFDIERLENYIMGPTEWLGLFAHAPNNVYKFAYSYELDKKTRSFTPAYFKGDSFSLTEMFSYLKYSTDFVTSTYQGLNKERTVVVTGPIWRDDEVYAFLKLIYLAKKNGFTDFNLHEMIQASCKTSNSDEYLRSLFAICNIAKTTLATREENPLESLPLFAIQHQSQVSIFDLLLEAANNSATKKDLMQICKESVLSFQNLALFQSFMRRVGRGENHSVKYTGHMTRFYDPDQLMYLKEVPEFLQACDTRKHTESGLFELKPDLAFFRLLSVLTAHVPGTSKRTGDLEKSFQLQSMACLMGENATLLNNRHALISECIALISSFIGKIIIADNTFKVIYGICSGVGAKFSAITKKLDDGIAAIKKIELKAQFKNFVGQVKKGFYHSVIFTNDMPNQPNRRDQLLKRMAETKARQDFSPEEKNAFLNLLNTQLQQLNN